MRGDAGQDLWKPADITWDEVVRSVVQPDAVDPEDIDPVAADVRD
jgi:hypothetical protein